MNKVANQSEYNRYKEKTVHGTPLLPFAKYHTNISDMLPFYPIHWHEEMEIIRKGFSKGLTLTKSKEAFNVYKWNYFQLEIIQNFVVEDDEVTDDTINSIFDPEMEDWQIIKIYNIIYSIYKRQTKIFL